MDDGPERFRVRFATGDAISVRKRRSFRDRERNDIERDLPGWPPGKPFAVRGFFRKSGQVDFTITFRDGSWTRLTATSSTDARKIVDLLNGVRIEDADDRDHADAEPPVPPG